MYEGYFSYILFHIYIVIYFFTINIIIGYITLFVALLVLFILLYYNPKITKTNNQRKMKHDKRISLFQELLLSVKEIKGFSIFEIVRNRTNETVSDYVKWNNKLNIDKNCEEITKCSEKLKNITGKEVNLYRCPYGEYNNTVINAANSLNYYSIQWSLDTLDYTGLTGNEMWNRLDRKLKKGDIIWVEFGINVGTELSDLKHNGTKHTADSLELLIKNIQSKGLEIKKVSDILYKDNYKINENGTQVIKNSLQ